MGVQAPVGVGEPAYLKLAGKTALEFPPLWLSPRALIDAGPLRARPG
jgi:hypothetical protein